MGKAYRASDGLSQGKWYGSHIPRILGAGLLKMVHV